MNRRVLGSLADQKSSSHWGKAHRIHLPVGAHEGLGVRRHSIAFR